MSTDQRFSAITRIYGKAALEVFERSHVCVVGIGGVGSWVAEALARTGFGTLTLVDLDDVAESNINRQVHALSSTVNHSKIEVMRERLLDINPEIKVNCLQDFVTYENVDELMSKDYDYLIDAIDSAAIKAAMLRWCNRNKVRAITIGGAGGKISPEQILIGDLNKTKNDPLLAKVRSQLRSFHGFSRNPKSTYQIDAVYSTEQVRYPDGEGGLTYEKPGEGSSLDCQSGFGSVTHITSSFANFAVAKVCERLLRRASLIK